MHRRLAVLPPALPTALLTASLTAAALLLSGCGGSASGSAPAPTAPAAVAWHGDEPDPARSRPSFVLRDTSGATYDFAERTGGRPTLLYFGYTNCPDECPTAMADIASALRAVDPAVAGQVEVVFVTTDPERDTPEVLRTWLDGFGTSFTGLLGTQAEVDAAQRAMELAPAERGGDVETLPGRPDQHEHKPGTAPHSHAGPLGYAVGHTNVIFAFDASDRLPVTYPTGVTPADIAADLPALARPSDPLRETS